jgi:hypothetical protein
MAALVALPLAPRNDMAHDQRSATDMANSADAANIGDCAKHHLSGAIIQSMRRRKRRDKPSLDGVRDKLRRAKAHRDKLQEVIGPVSNLGTRPFAGEVLGDGRVHLYRWHNPPVLDVDAVLILGDCIQNLRSSLDHLAYQLVVLNKKTPSNRWGFPILHRPPRKRWRYGRQQPLSVPGVSARARQIIEDVQPYKGGDIGLRLAELHELDIIDKHRHLLVSIHAANTAVTAWFGEPQYGEPRYEFPDPAVHGAVAVRVHWPVPRPALDPNLRFGVGVNFDRRVGKRFAGCSVILAASRLLVTVEDDIVNDLFAPLFP